VLTLGSVTGAGSTTILVGTGAAGFTVDGVTSSTYSVGASTTTGTIVIGGTAQSGATAITLGSSSATSTVIIQVVQEHLLH